MKYHLARGEEQLGTFNDLDVSAGLREGRFKPTDLCWAEGMPEWRTLGSHLQELNPEGGAPPTAESGRSSGTGLTGPTICCQADRSHPAVCASMCYSCDVF